MDSGTIVAIVGLALTVVNAWVLRSLSVARQERAASEKRLNTLLAKYDAEHTKNSDKLEAEMERRFDSVRETTHELRNRLHEIAVEGARNYVKREEFVDVVKEIRLEFRSVTAEQTRAIEGALGRFEQKLDRKVDK